MTHNYKNYEFNINGNAEIDSIEANDAKIDCIRTKNGYRYTIQ